MQGRIKRILASIFATLINEHKTNWIDEIILLRDFLIHPTKDTHQIMFKMNLVNINGDLICNSIISPCIGKFPIYEYAERQLKNVDRFANEFQSILIKNKFNV